MLLALGYFKKSYKANQVFNGFFKGRFMRIQDHLITVLQSA